MSIHLVGDLHGQSSSFKYLNTTKFPEQKTMDKDDLVICLGDFGLWWDILASKEEVHWRKWLMEKKFQMCFIEGNHENFTLIEKEFTEIDFLGAKAMEYKTKFGSIIKLNFGEVYEYQGKKILCIGKAMSQDKVYRTEGIDWWPEEEPSFAEYEHALSNIEKHEYKINYILSHTSPQKIIGPMFNIWNEGKALDPVSKFHDHVVELLQEKGDGTLEEWHFGHFHENTNYGLDYIDFYCHYNYDPFLLVADIPIIETT